MAVVGGRQGDACFPGKPEKLGEDFRLLPKAVILYFQKEIPLAENPLIIQSGIPGTGIIPGGKGPRDFPGQTGGQGDEPFMVLLEQLLVHPGLAIKAFGPGPGNHGDEVLIALLVFTEKHQVAVLAVHAALDCAGTGRHIDLTADNGVNPPLLGGFIEVNDPIHGPVVGDGHRLLAQLFHPIHELLNAAGAVQQAVFRMQMKMGKGHEQNPPVFIFDCGICLYASGFLLKAACPRWFRFPLPGKRRVP